LLTSRQESPAWDRNPRSAAGPLMQAILLTTSLLLVAGMLGSVAWLSALRLRAEPEPAQSETFDEQ